MTHIYAGGQRVSNVSLRKLLKSTGAHPGVWTADDGSTTNGIAVGNDGSVYTCHLRNANINATNATHRKRDSDGNLIWSADYGGSPQGIAVDRHGNVYVAGVRIDGGGGQFATHRKYDPDGTLLWSRDHGDIVRKIAVDWSGNVYITGARTDVLGGSFATTRKYDTNGSLLFSVDFGGHTWGLSVFPDHGFVVLGDNPSGTNVRRFDPNGDQLWTFNHGVALLNIAEIQFDVAGNVLFATEATGSGNTHRKLDPAGNQVWVKAHGAAGRSICVDSDGASYFGGLASSTITTRRLDAAGAPVWSQAHGGGVLAVEPEDGRVGAFTDDGMGNGDINGTHPAHPSHRMFSLF